MEYEKLFYNVSVEIMIFLYGKTFDKFGFAVDLKQDEGKRMKYFEFTFRINGISQIVTTDMFTDNELYRNVELLNIHLGDFYKRIQNISNINKLQYLHQCPQCKTIFSNPSNKINTIVCNYCNCRNNPPDQQKEYVYFFQSQLTGLIKIGYSSNPERRKKKLETMHGSPLNIILLIEGNMKLEKTLHDYFSEYRTIGEWFNPGITILNYIKKNSKRKIKVILKKREYLSHKTIN